MLIVFTEVCVLSGNKCIEKGYTNTVGVVIPVTVGQYSVKMKFYFKNYFFFKFYHIGLNSKSSFNITVFFSM